MSGIQSAQSRTSPFPGEWESNGACYPTSFIALSVVARDLAVNVNYIHKQSRLIYSAYRLEFCGRCGIDKLLKNGDLEF